MATTLENLFSALPTLRPFHAPSSPVYSLLDKVARDGVEKLFREGGDEAPKNFPPFGAIFFPYFSMGAISSLDLFGLDELILFSFYWLNRGRYKIVADIGANIGLHSLLMRKCGFEVRLFEPDPIHFQKLGEILKKNGFPLVGGHCAAVSNRDGMAEFVRVLGNTTSNHLAGAKQPYGRLEKFEVPLFNIKEIIRSVDLIKMDVEGHESEILLATDAEDWEKVDGFIEVGSLSNAQQIFSHFKEMKNLHIFSQKRGWQKVQSLEDMPVSYKEGSIFITRKDAMYWG